MQQRNNKDKQGDGGGDTAARLLDESVVIKILKYRKAVQHAEDKQAMDDLEAKCDEELKRDGYNKKNMDWEFNEWKEIDVRFDTHCQEYYDLVAQMQRKRFHEEIHSPSAADSSDVFQIYDQHAAAKKKKHWDEDQAERDAWDTMCTTRMLARFEKVRGDIRQQRTLHATG